MIQGILNFGESRGGPTVTMTIEPSDFPYDHGHNDHFGLDHTTIIPFLSSNGHGKMVKINRYFIKFQQQKIWNCRDGYDQIWIDHSDCENLIILVMVMVKFGLTILTIELQFGQ
jgi:hypothetical protein